MAKKLGRDFFSLKIYISIYFHQKTYKNYSLDPKTLQNNSKKKLSESQKLKSNPIC